MRRVAVIGAGVAGLTAAHRLGAAGAACDVYERWPGLGGQAASLDVGGGVLLERYYHHLFPSDRHIVALYEELGMPDAVEWWPSSVGMFSEGSLHPFTTPLDLVRFKPLSLRARLRMGLAVVALQRRHADVTRFEAESARSWVEREMGAEVWEKVWGPLLHAKFGDRAEDLSMAWLWSKLTLRRQIKGRDARRERLGYPRGGWEPLFGALRRSIEASGGRVLIDRPAVSIARTEDGLLVTSGAPGSFRRGHDPRGFHVDAEPERYDAVIATVPCDVFERLLDSRLARAIGDGYLSRLRSIEYQAALCLLLEVGERFLPYYWTNIAAPGFPFIGLIEQANLVPPERYGGRRFLYVANYRPRDDELLGLGPEELLAAYEPGIRRVIPRFDGSRVKNAWVFCEPAAQPVVTVGYHERIPPMDTGVPGLLVANTAQVYPEDRGTNYAVRLGDQAAGLLLTSR